MSDCVYTQEGDADTEKDAIYLPLVKQNLLACSVCKVSQEVLETITLTFYSCSQEINIQLKQKKKKKSVHVCEKEREQNNEEII